MSAMTLAEGGGVGSGVASTPQMLTRCGQQGAWAAPQGPWRAAGLAFERRQVGQLGRQREPWFRAMWHLAGTKIAKGCHGLEGWRIPLEPAARGGRLRGPNEDIWLARRGPRLGDC